MLIWPSVPLPTEPNVTVTTITATSISLSWSVPTDQMVTSSDVMWQVFSPSTEVDSNVTSGRITVTSYIHTIKGLKSSTNYAITVTVTNIVGSSTSSPMIITTEGKYTYE